MHIRYINKLYPLWFWGHMWFGGSDLVASSFSHSHYFSHFLERATHSPSLSPPLLLHTPSPPTPIVQASLMY